MLDHQVIDAWTGVAEDLVITTENPYDLLFQRQQARKEAGNPYALPGGKPVAEEPDLRVNLLSGLAAVVITVVLFVGGIAAVLAPAPALAVPAHMILY